MKRHQNYVKWHLIRARDGIFTLKGGIFTPMGGAGCPPGSAIVTSYQILKQFRLIGTIRRTNSVLNIIFLSSFVIIHIILLAYVYLCQHVTRAELYRRPRVLYTVITKTPHHYGNGLNFMRLWFNINETNCLWNTCI